MPENPRKASDYHPGTKYRFPTALDPPPCRLIERKTTVENVEHPVGPSFVGEICSQLERSPWAGLVWRNGRKVDRIGVLSTCEQSESTVAQDHPI